VHPITTPAVPDNFQTWYLIMTILLPAANPKKNGEQEDIISNTTLIEAITTGDKVDVNIFVYILEQKDQIIKTLKEEITLLNDKIYLMAMTGNKNLSKAEEPVEKKKDKKQPVVKIAEYKQILTDTNFVIFDFIHL
jgi:lipopolysaccharide export LptBFGC system permease protein LptF